MFNYLKENSYNIVKMFLTQIALAMLGVIMSMATHTNDNAFLISSILCTVIYVYILYLMTHELGTKDKPAIDGGRAKLHSFKGFWISFCANIPNIVCGIMAVVFFFFLTFQQPVEVYDANDNKIDVYIADENKENFDKVSLFSNNGAKAVIFEKEGYNESQIKDQSGKTTSVYDKNKNELILYTPTSESISVSLDGEADAIPGHWAANLHAVPLMIATFLQMIYFGIKSEWFGNSHYIYLITPFIPIFFCTLGYYFGATGKRILFFLPERKQKPPKYR